MSAWLFIFGRTHEFSFHELAALLPLPITRITPDVVRVEDPDEEIIPEQLINRLGGTVKIAQEKGSITFHSVDTILQFFGDMNRNALTFGVSIYGSAPAFRAQALRGVKEALEARGIRARYVMPHEGKTLSSVVVKKQGVHEFILVTAEDGFIVGETVAIQDFEAWNTRDYGRPFADPKAGMLPPKVARMAVNLAGKTGKLLDPFCGMGTILGEALLTGWRVYGSDQSQDAVDKAKKNLEWLHGGVELFVSDATHVSEHLPAHSVDAIVTEPYLGPAVVRVNDVKNIMKGLKKLYIGCLRDWYRVIKAGGKIVIALPEYAINGRTFFVKNVIDRCENLGYTVTVGPLDYGREKAIVRRKFFVLQK